MENRSRVERYREHRKKIENMDVYSFADSPTLKRNLPEHGDLDSVDRKKDGISGFTKMEESIYDAFGAGHSST